MWLIQSKIWIPKAIFLLLLNNNFFLSRYVMSEHLIKGLMLVMQ